MVPFNVVSNEQDFIAGASMSGKRGYAARISGINTVSVGNDTTVSNGVIQNEPASGGAVTVQTGGTSAAIAAAAITAGQAVKVTSAGKYTPASTGNSAAGIALSDASGDGVTFNLQILPHVAL